MIGSLPDAITCAKFQVEIFRGYDFTGGRNDLSPIDFCIGLTTVQCYCAACDKYETNKIHSHKSSYIHLTERLDVMISLFRSSRTVSLRWLSFFLRFRWHFSEPISRSTAVPYGPLSLGKESS